MIEEGIFQGVEILEVYTRKDEGRMKAGSEAKLPGTTPSPYRCHAETTQLQNVPKQWGYTGDEQGGL